MRFLNPFSIWTQVPVANRLVEVNTKTGFAIDTNNDKTGYTVSTNSDKTGYTVSTVSDKTGYSLTAGSYSVRASSTQQGTVSFSGATSGTSVISSVTTTRAFLAGGGNSTAEPNDATIGRARVKLTAATTVTSTTNGTGSTINMDFSVCELF